MRLGSAFGAFLDPVADKVLSFLSSSNLTRSLSISDCFWLLLFFKTVLEF